MDQTRTPTPRILLLLTWVSGIALLGLPAQSVIGGLTEAEALLLGEIVRMPVTLLTAVLGLWLVLTRAMSGAERRSWILLEVTFALTVAARGVVLANQLSGSSPASSFPSPADYLFLAGLPPMVAGVMLMPTARRTRVERLKLGVDSLIVVAGTCMALWYLEIAPLLQTPGADSESIAFMVAIPILDLLLLFALVTLLMRRPEHNAVIRLLGGSILLKVVTDTSYIVAVIQFGTAFSPNSWPFLLWAAADLLALLAVQRRLSQTYEADVHRRQGRNFFWLPYGGIALAYGMLIYVGRNESLYALGGMIAGALVLTGLVITRQMIAQWESHRLAMTDPLTGLANRARINRQLVAMTRRAPRHGTCKAVLLIDLDRFKPINDTHGHEAGDAVLKAIAAALRVAIRSGDTAGRLGGDEFAVVLPNLPSKTAAESIAERLVEALRTPVIFEDALLAIDASIGIAYHDETTLNRPEVLLAHADVAMYAAKRSGRGRSLVYRPEMDARTQADDLLRAVADGELVVHFQPIVALADGRQRGIEALVRWNHPTQGLRMLEEFVDVAEETGTVVQIDHWAIREACRQVASWQRKHSSAAGLQIGINVSARTLAQEDLQPTLVAILNETGFPAAQLVLEIAESSVPRCDEATVDRLRAVREMGVEIAVDGFGAGLAALSYLETLPLTRLKIGPSFIRQVATDADRYAVSEALIHLLKAYHLSTVVGGVETPDQHRCLVEMGCDLAQGSFYAGAMTMPLSSKVGSGEYPASGRG